MRRWAGSQGLVHQSVRSARDEVLANFSIRWLGAVIGVVLMSGLADAQEKSQFTLFNPTPPDQMRSFSTDRPTKSNVPYTVDASHFQYETDLVSFTHQVIGTARTDTLLVPNPTFKVGVTNNADFEINVPIAGIRAYGAAAPANALWGIGDTFVRSKINLWGDDGGDSAAAIIPYVKAPSAPIGIGNGAVEGGLI